MTYRERSKWYCDKCSLSMKPVACGYLMRNKQDDCIENDNFMSGWELGQQDTIEEIEAILNKSNESRCEDFFTIAEIKRKIEQLKKI